MMTTGLLIAGVIGMIWAYGYVQYKRGQSKVREKDLMGEIKSAQKANQIENDHKHDSRDDIIDGL